MRFTPSHGNRLLPERWAPCRISDEVGSVEHTVPLVGHDPMVLEHLVPLVGHDRMALEHLVPLVGHDRMALEHLVPLDTQVNRAGSNVSRRTCGIRVGLPVVKST